MGFWQLLFWFVCSLALGLWLFGWACLIAEKLWQKKQTEFSKWFKSLVEQSEKRFCLLVTLIICSGCCPNTGVQTKIECPPMLREATYKAMQADEVADYRIAVEKCRVF